MLKETADRLFDIVFVRPPSSAYKNCVSSNAQRNEIDVQLAREQHRAYVSVLKECGVKVVEFKSLVEKPDSVFMQDPALLGKRRSLIGRFGEPSRRGEEEIFLDELKRDFSNVMGTPRKVDPPGTVEGGDIVVTDHGLFIGESTRTNKDGIRQMARFFSGTAVRSVETDLLHLLCGCSYLTNETMIIAPEIVDPNHFAEFRLITVAKEEAYATDALYVGEGRVIIPSGYEKVARKLKAADFKPIQLDMSEFFKGDGGVTCLSSPVYNTL